MFRLKILISIIFFSFLLIATSFIKNQTRVIERKIFNTFESVAFKEKDLYESQLDYSYLTSPSSLDKKIEKLQINKYAPMDHAKIFLSMSNFLDLKNKIVLKKKNNEKKIKEK